MIETKNVDLGSGCSAEIVDYVTCGQFFDMQNAADGKPKRDAIVKACVVSMTKDGQPVAKVEDLPLKAWRKLDAALAALIKDEESPKAPSGETGS